MKGVKYVAPVYDMSGYAEASRNYILALHQAGVPLTVHPHCFETAQPDVCSVEDKETLDSLVDKDIDFDIVIVHLTPDHIPMYVAKYPDKYVISYTVWETTLLHPKWAADCNMASEVMVPCDWNVKAFKDSGVTVPITKVHHGIDTTLYATPPTEEDIASVGMSGTTFNFLSVMQWNFRKNPEGLLRAYFNTFTAEDDVRLIIKAFIGKGQPPAVESSQIKDVINRIKEDMGLPSYPRVRLIVNKLSNAELQKLYASCDAYVSLTHGEGFGLTAFEAGLAGKPVIVTGMGGNMEYMSFENSFPISAEPEYVYGMSTFNPWYLGNQQWAHPSLPEAARTMRYVFDNIDVAKIKGTRLRQRILSEFSWESVAQQMIGRLKEL